MTFATILFLVSLVLLVGFLVFRSWEEKRGVRLFATVRARLDERVLRTYHHAVTGTIPYRYRTAFFVFLQKMIHEAVLVIVGALRAIERPLTRLSYRMRMSTPKANGKEVSSFLRTIVPLKKRESGTDGTDSEKSV